MTPQERDVIAGIFDRLRQAANQPRDPEAEAFIAERLREQPYAPYAMAQSVYVQEQALTNLHQQVESLQAQLRELQSRASEAPQAPAPGGFLSGIFGGAPAQPRPGSVPPVPPRGGEQPSSAWTHMQGGQPMQAPPPEPQPGPWSNQPQQLAGRGGGFMASALTTAAGVAGGLMLGNVLSHAFGGGSSGTSAAAATGTNSLASSVDSFGSGGNSQQAAYDKGASDQAAYDRGADDQAGYDKASSDQGGDQASYDDASYDDAGYDDGGGSDDDSWV